MASTAPLSDREKDIQMMLACATHLGTKNVESQMKQYVFKRKPDGIHLLNLGKTYDKINLAARIIVAIENPADVVVVSARMYGQRPTLKFAQHTGATTIAGRFTPGSFTNQITNVYKEPRLLIVADPRVDHQAVTEAAYANIPVIAFCDSDSPLAYVDLAIPANNKGKQSIGLMFWMLAREVLKMRGTVNEATPWDTMVDLFFYRDPEDVEKEEAEAEATRGGDEWTENPAGDWGGAATGTEDWAVDPQATLDWSAQPAATPAAGWETAAAPAAAAFPQQVAGNWDSAQ